MNRIAATALAASAFTLPGCLIIDGSTDPSYTGYGRVSRARLSEIVANNTQTRLGQTVEQALSHYPAENVSLIQSAANARGEEVSVYRVFARSRSSSFVRYLVFQNDRLVLLTDDRDDLEAVGVKDD